MNINRFISKFKISTRIYFGFTTVIISLIIVAGMGYWSMEVTRNNFETFKKINDKASLISKLDKEVESLKRHVQVFTLTGQPGEAGRVRGSVQKFGEGLNAATLILESKKEVDLLARMGKHFTTYTDTFQFAVDERSRRDQLVQKDLNTISARILQQDNLGSQLGLKLNNLIQKSNRDLYQYLSDPDYRLISNSVDKIDSIWTRNKLVPENTKSLIQDYKRLLIQVGQATRGYLFLIHVVMSGEALELSNVSSQLKKLLTKDVEPLSSQIIRTANSFQIYGLFFSVAIVFLGLIIALVISRSITVPLTAMTNVLNQLSQGGKEAEIPGIENDDEIGTMAKAANVFKQKNAETKRLLAAIEEHEKELEGSHDELDQFVYTVSHDLKSPIVTSMGFIGMMKDLAASGKTQEALSKIEILERSNKRMSQLIQDLLDLSRVGRVEMDIVPLRTDELIRNLLSNWRNQMAKRNINASIEGRLPEFEGNQSRVLQVFENLISNAVKYLPDDGNGEIFIGGTSNEEIVRIFVKDNGSGIPEKYHEKVFGLFQRLQTSAQGTGIGLSIVQKVMKFHQGKVWIDSKGDGSGCTFWLEFPVKQPSKCLEN